MTRKRKNVQEQEGEAQSGGFEGYGFNASNYAAANSTFPEKKRFNDKKERFEKNRGKKREWKEFGEKDFEKLYGKVGGESNDESKFKPKKEEEEAVDDYQNGYQNEEEWKSRRNNDGRGEFPKDIVGYLRSIDNVRKQEGKIEEFILDNCAREIAGEETTLLEWTEAAVVVESVFGSSQYGAALFLESISKLKHKTFINLLFAGASGRTIENLIYKLSPIEKLEHVEMIAKFAELLCDNWQDAVTTQQSAYLIRTILRITSGFGAKTKQSEKENEKSIFVNKEIKNELKKVYDRIAILAFDENLNADLIDNPICSLVIQDAIDADSIWKSIKLGEYVLRLLNKDENGEKLRKMWQQKNVSRIWEKIMEKCREETRSQVWMGGISGNLSEIVNHQFANFPLQKLIGSVTSLELATDIIDEISPMFAEIVGSNKIGVAIAVLKCAGNHENAQEILLKQLRIVYNANKASNKTNFIFNLLTNNQYDGQHFELQSCTVHGSLLMQELLNFTKIKTVTACIEQFSGDLIREMSCHKIASRIIQSCLTSTKLDDRIKNRICEAFTSSDWERLISDVYGSHVFENIWNFVDLKKKQEIMNLVIRINNFSKFWKFAMLKCDAALYRKNKKMWLQKWKEQSNC